MNKVTCHWALFLIIDITTDTFVYIIYYVSETSTSFCRVLVTCRSLSFDKLQFLNVMYFKYLEANCNSYSTKSSGSDQKLQPENVESSDKFLGRN